MDLPLALCVPEGGRGRGRVRVPERLQDAFVMHDWHVALSSDMGGRLTNEDGVGCVALDDTWLVAFVLDGHGGNETMLLVQEHLAAYLRDAMQHLPPRDALMATFVRLDALCTSDVSGTCVAGALIGPSIFVFHLGDCRVVTPTFETTDHKPNHPCEQKRIEAAGGAVVWHRGDVPRVNGLLAVSRALGDKDSAMRQVSTVPDVTETHATSIVLATDGVWDVIDTTRARDMLHHQQKADDFVVQAGASGDNRTALTLYRLARLDHT